MGPVGEAQGVAIDVEVVEGVPHPDGIETGVEVNDGVTEDGGGSGEAGKIFKVLGVGNDDEPVAIGELEGVVGKIDGDEVESGGDEALVELVNRNLADGLAGEIDFAGQFKALKDMKYSGTLSLETHYRNAAHDLYASSVESMDGLFAVLKKV